MTDDFGNEQATQLGAANSSGVMCSAFRISSAAGSEDDGADRLGHVESSGAGRTTTACIPSGEGWSAIPPSATLYFSPIPDYPTPSRHDMFETCYAAAS